MDSLVEVDDGGCNDCFGVLKWWDCTSDSLILRNGVDSWTKATDETRKSMEEGRGG